MMFFHIFDHGVLLIMFEEDEHGGGTVAMDAGEVSGFM